MKYALLIYKFQPSVSFHCHLFMDLQYCPSILSVNMPQLQKTGKITLPPSCRLDTKTQNLQADCGKKKNINVTMFDIVRSEIIQNAQLPWLV